MWGHVSVEVGVSLCQIIYALCPCQSIQQTDASRPIAAAIQLIVNQCSWRNGVGGVSFKKTSFSKPVLKGINRRLCPILDTELRQYIRDVEFNRFDPDE
jgi:hypothetical protein